LKKQESNGQQTNAQGPFVNSWLVGLRVKNKIILKNIKAYKTGLLVAVKDRNEPKPPYKGKNWQAQIKKVNLKTHSSDEIIILSKKQEVAQRALNLILGCLNLYSGDPLIEPGQFHLLAYRDKDIKNLPLHEKARFSNYHGTGGVPIACAMAAKASFRLKNIYAISKYNFSITNCSISHEDLEPYRSHISVSPFPDDHVRFCQAIISCYSVLEELGLEIRASQEKPSMINGNWNPPVKIDLEGRLTKAGINLQETLLWTLRGPKRKIELKKAPVLASIEEWSNGIMVRDSSIKIVDAIAYASWLRSYVSSHKTKDVTSVISPYDVNNIQHLSRRLILEILGFWRY
jgi:hypothetical protein